MTFVSATPSTGSYDSATGTWTAGTVTTSTPATLILTAVINTGGMQTSTAAITHSDQPDPTSADNTASVTITAAVPTGGAGQDVSYPQCGKTFPAGPAFGIVGVNGGLANDLNPCLGPSPSYQAYQLTELYWAESAPAGGTPQPKASLYVNTADPGNVYNGTPIPDWPTAGSTPYGTCTTTTVTTTSGTFTVGQNSPACAWQYGDNRSSQDASWLVAAASAINAQSPPVRVPSGAGGYPWWLDVETVNSWQSGTSGQAMNVADLQGMIAGLTAAGAVEVGAYSTATQWNQITGGTTTAAAGTLFGIPDWIPGAQNLSGAQSNCAQPSFTGGRVTVTQWVAKGADYDQAC